MAIRDFFKFNRKTFFNPSGWVDVGYIARQTDFFKSVLLNLLTKPTPSENPETFEQAMQRLNLTEEAVSMGATNYRLYAAGFLLIAFLVFFYSFYHLFRYHAFLHFVLCSMIVGLLLAYAFKYDFWSLQMRKRKLGMTSREWLKSLLGSKEKAS